jgi:hypothetical protein
MQRVPVMVTYSNGEEVLNLDGVFVVGATERVPDEGGHGEVRTYLETRDDETATAYCMVCVAEDMAEGRITNIKVNQ